jgi:hypothetical protein
MTNTNRDKLEMNCTKCESYKDKVCTHKDSKHFGKKVTDDDFCLQFRYREIW